MLSQQAAKRCVFDSRSDPYTKLSLYDPATGESNSFHTKTIKKVSQRGCSVFPGFFFFFSGPETSLNFSLPVS